MLIGFVGKSLPEIIKDAEEEIAATQDWLKQLKFDYKKFVDEQNPEHRYYEIKILIPARLVPISEEHWEHVIKCAIAGQRIALEKDKEIQSQKYNASWPGAPPEEGVITSVGEKNVFVRYRSQHPSANGQATAPEDLRFPNVIRR